MSIRRRAIKARVDRDTRLARQLAEMDESLWRMQAVIDEAKRDGLSTLSRYEFWRRYHAKAAA